MARKVVTTYIDDLTGESSEDIGTHTLLLDGAGVNIDLTSENYDKLQDALRPFLQAQGARRVRAKAAGMARRQSSAPARNQDSAKIRIWAKENGYDVNVRGRVSAKIREAYEQAELDPPA